MYKSVNSAWSLHQTLSDYGVGGSLSAGGKGFYAPLEYSLDGTLFVAGNPVYNSQRGRSVVE